VDLPVVADLPELSPELVVNALGAVARDRKAAALLGTLGAEGRDHNVSVRLQGAANLRDVATACPFLDEEVEHRAVVPEVVRVLGQLDLGYVADDPRDPLGGGSESVTNLLGGTVPVISTSPATVNQYVEAKQMRIIVVSGERRVDHLKDVPTFKELGYDIVMTQYRGFAARKGLPTEARAKLADAIHKATREPAFKDFMAKNHQPDGYLGPDEFNAFARADFELMGRLTQKLGAKK
jgi:hypothetical protein